MKTIRELLHKLINGKSHEIVMWTEFDPRKRTWIGIGVQMGIGGTHNIYNVFYNGSCDSQHFNTEKEARSAVRDAYNKLKEK